jgi:thymidine kinase
MPVKYQVHDNGKYVYAKATGKLTPEEIIDYVHKVKVNSKIKEGFKELFDVRFITESKVTIESFTRITKEVIADKKRIFRNKLAIVVSKVDSFDKAKFYEKMVPAEKHKVIVFNTLEIAKTWLDVDKP